MITFFIFLLVAISLSLSLTILWAKPRAYIFLLFKDNNFQQNVFQNLANRVADGCYNFANYFWTTKNWNQCNEYTFLQTREVKCIDKDGNEVDDSCCNPNEKPITTQACYVYKWNVGDWGNCTEGSRTRIVQCERLPDYQIVADEFCQETKPADSEACQFGWYVYTWSPENLLYENGKCYVEGTVLCYDYVAKKFAPNYFCTDPKIDYRVPVDCPTLQQWASSIEVSSSPPDLGHQPSFMIGPPDGKTWFVGYTTSYMWLKAYYDTPVYANKIELYTNHGYYVYQIIGYNTSTLQMKTLWRENNYIWHKKYKYNDRSYFTFETSDFPIDLIMMWIDSDAIPDAKYIDAIGLYGVTSK